MSCEFSKGCLFAMGCAVLQVPSMAPGTIAAAYVLEELP